MRTTRRLGAMGAALALFACSDSAPPAAEAAAGSAAAAAARGKQHFESFCASCHGARGDGDGPAAVALDPRPASIGNRAYMTGKTDDYLFQVIKEGGASVGRSGLMAPWGGLLSDEQIRDVIAHIRSLAH